MAEEKKEIAIKIDEKNLPSAKWTKELQLVKDIVAKGCDETEFKLLVHMSKVYNLNPLKKEIWAVKYANKPALIFVGRDGLLRIAHDSGKFGSMETTIELEEDTRNPNIKNPYYIRQPISATCSIWKTNYDKPFKTIVYFDEFDRKMALWKEKPKMMLGKVAESQCLRKAFNIHGLYVPEEMPEAEPIKDEQNGN